MARLTWENVANPNFSGVADSYRVMSELLGKAAASGKSALDIFGDAKTSAADKAILQRMLAADTGAEYDPTAIIGSDAANASIAALKDVGDWGGTVLNRDTTRMTNEQTGKNNTYLNEGRDYEKNNAAALNNALRLAAGSPAALEGVPLDARPGLYGAVVGDVNTLLTSDLNRDSTTQRMKITDYSQDRLVRGDKISDAALVAMDDVNANSIPGDIESAQRYVYSRTDWTPEVRAQVLSRIGGMSGGAGVSGAAGVGSAISAAAGTSGASNWAPVAGNANASAISTAAAELGVDPVDLATIISYESGGTFDPSIKGPKTHRGQHIGLIQFGDEEQKKYGAAPGQTFEQQMKAVVAYMKDRGVKPGMSMEDLYSTVNAGSPGRPNAKDGNTSDATVRDKVNGRAMAQHRARASSMFTALTPEEIKEGGYDPARTLTQNLDVAKQSSDAAVGTLVSEYTQTLGKRNRPNEAAAELAKALPGTDPEKLEIKINDMIRDSWSEEKGVYQLSAAQAAAALQLASAPDSFGWDITNFYGQKNLDQYGKRKVDPTLLKKLTESIINNAASTAVVDDARRQQAQAAVIQLEAKRDALQARYQNAAKALEVRGNSATPALVQEVARLKAEFEAAIRDVALANSAGIAKQTSVTPPDLAPPVSMSGRITGR